MRHMRRWTTALALLLALAMTACAVADALPAEEPEELFGDPWFNTIASGNLPDTAPDGKDDFYCAVNYDTLAAHQDEYYMPMSNSGEELQAAVTALLQDGSLAGEEITQLKIFWELAADTDTLRETGYDPVTPYLERIEAAGSIGELNAVLTAEDFPFSPFVAMPVAPPAMDEVNAVWILPALSLSSDPVNGAEYYTEPTEDAATITGIAGILGRAEYISGSMKALGIPESAFFDTLLSVYNTEVSYVSKAYSNYAATLSDYGYASGALQCLSMEDLDRLCSRFPMTATLKKFGKDQAPVFVVMGSEWMTALDELWTEANLEQIKLMARFKMLMETAPYLNPDPASSIRTFNGLPPLDSENNPWNACNQPDTFAPLLAKLYTEEVLGDRVKERLTGMTGELIGIFRTLLEETEWLSAEGREKALEKLDRMRLNILEPDGGYYDYSGLNLTPASGGGSLFDAWLAVKAYLNEQENLSIGQPAKADLVWRSIRPTSTNCFYNPSDNSVNLFPGFIYSFNSQEDATKEHLLACLSFVIAHEISHAFDYVGSQIDAFGRGNAILSDSDLEVFLEKENALADYYNRITILPGILCNGDLQRAENAADLIAAKVTARLAKARGLDLQAFFREFAGSFAMVLPEDALATLVLDSHAPYYLRVNVNVQMTDEFHEAFDVKEGDGMYLPPEERLSIWGK